MAAPESHRHRPTRTAGAYQALVPLGGRGTVVVEVVELSLGNHCGHTLSGMAGSIVQQRLGASPSSHRARNAHCPALSSPPPPAITPRVTARSPLVVPAGQGPG